MHSTSYFTCKGRFGRSAFIPYAHEQCEFESLIVLVNNNVRKALSYRYSDVQSMKVFYQAIDGILVNSFRTNEAYSKIGCYNKQLKDKTNSCLVYSETKNVSDEHGNTLTASETLYRMHCCCSDSDLCYKQQKEVRNFAQLYCPQDTRHFLINISGPNFAIVQKAGDKYEEIIPVEHIELSNICYSTIYIQRGLCEFPDFACASILIENGANCTDHKENGSFCTPITNTTIGIFPRDIKICCQTKIEGGKADINLPRATISKELEYAYAKCRFSVYRYKISNKDMFLCFFFYDPSNKTVHNTWPSNVKMLKKDKEGINSVLPNFDFFEPLTWERTIEDTDMLQLESSPSCFFVGGCFRRSIISILQNCPVMEVTYMMCACSASFLNSSFCDRKFVMALKKGKYFPTSTKSLCKYTDPIAIPIKVFCYVRLVIELDKNRQKTGFKSYEYGFYKYGDQIFDDDDSVEISERDCTNPSNRFHAKLIRPDVLTDYVKDRIKCEMGVVFDSAGKLEMQNTSNPSQSVKWQQSHNVDRFFYDNQINSPTMEYSLICCTTKLWTISDLVNGCSCRLINYPFAEKK
uniref:Uncharacterized protein n=1 Tax=Ditylenchus dipsaci TaxID=166011 RepID=A0A915DJU1_9BILA